MKKIIALILTVIFIASALVSCNRISSEDDDTVIRIGYMTGPTGMGMAKLIHDQAELENTKYVFTQYTDASLATADLISGKIDMACIPTNTAATLYNKTNGQIITLAINCLNSLYFMKKSTADLQLNDIYDLEGKTIYTIQNGTPAAILQHLLDEADVNATVKTTYVQDGEEKNITAPNDLAALLIAGSDIDIALVPEPVATAVPLKLTSLEKSYNYEAVINLSDAWSDIYSSPVAMGCIIANKDFVSEHKEITDSFLDEYKSSIQFISNYENIDVSAQYIAEAKVLDAAAAAKKSLINLSGQIAYVDGSEMQAILTNFYTSIGLNLIGGTLPDDEFYYKN